LSFDKDANGDAEAVSIATFEDGDVNFTDIITGNSVV
jgi:hypothetical protein